ncbi:hypothetical protein GCM10009804_44180 [Kribbella hippodromi]|uniref:Uncharacterized protein n=1 Tax=Kribbella hippodromi TaxID=434347 RepID=A0ABP4PLU0_9ACTN
MVVPTTADEAAWWAAEGVAVGWAVVGGLGTGRARSMGIAGVGRWRGGVALVAEVVGGESAVWEAVGWEVGLGLAARAWVRVVRAARSACGVLGWRVASVRTGRPEASKRMFCWVIEPWVRPMVWRWVMALVIGVRRVTSSPGASAGRRWRRDFRLPATRNCVMRRNSVSDSWKAVRRAR